MLILHYGKNTNQKFMLTACLGSHWHIGTGLDASNVFAYVFSEAMLIHDVQEEWFVQQFNSSDYVSTNVEVQKLSEHKKLCSAVK